MYYILGSKTSLYNKCVYGINLLRCIRIKVDTAKSYSSLPSPTLAMDKYQAVGRQKSIVLWLTEFMGLAQSCCSLCCVVGVDWGEKKRVRFAPSDPFYTMSSLSDTSFINCVGDVLPTIYT